MSDFKKHHEEAFIDYLTELSETDIDFDLRAQDINDWLFLQKTVPTLIVSSAGGVLPFQAEGLLHNRPFYFRSEFGSAEITLGEENGEPPYLLSSRTDEHCYTASIDYPEDEETGFFVIHLLKTIELLKLAPYFYEFPSNLIIYNKEKETWEQAGGKEETLGAWGYNAEEAYINLINCWKTDFPGYLKAADPSPTPIKEDKRNFTGDNLDFTVNWDNLPEQIRKLKK